MSTNNSTENMRDDVLFAFQEACEHPTAADIIEWTHRYPQYAEDIRAHAAIARDWESHKGAPIAEPDEIMLARGHSRILNALYNAETDAKAAAEPGQSFQEIMTERGTDVPRLSKQLEIGRSVLADLVNGCIVAPVGKRLVDALTTALGISYQEFESALERAINSPRLGFAKADGTPMLKPQSYKDVIRSSGMSTERIEYWLSED